MTLMTRKGLAPLLGRLRLYNQPQRLLILASLETGPKAVSAIERETEIGQPALSQQLGELRRAGLITAKREAREVIYDFASPMEKHRTRIVLSLLTNKEDIIHGAPASLRHAGAQFATILRD